MRILASLLIATLAVAAATESSGAEPTAELRALRDRGLLDAAETGVLDRVRARAGEPEAMMDALDGIVAARMQAERFPLMTMGYLYHVSVELEAALDTYRWAFRLSVESHGPGSAEAARCLAALGNVEADLGDLEQGERHLRQSVEIVEELYGADDPRTASSLFRLAAFLFGRERYREARALWERTRDTFERLAAAAPDEERRRSHALQAARSIHNLGQVHHRLGEIPEAFEDLQRAVDTNAN